MKKFTISLLILLFGFIGVVNAQTTYNNEFTGVSYIKMFKRDKRFTVKGMGLLQWVSYNLYSFNNETNQITFNVVGDYYHIQNVRFMFVDGEKYEFTLSVKPDFKHSTSRYGTTRWTYITVDVSDELLKSLETKKLKFIQYTTSDSYVQFNISKNEQIKISKQVKNFNDIRY